MESFEEYKNTIKKVKGPRKHKVQRAYGVQDAYRHYMKKCNAKKIKYLSSSDYYKIIRGVNKLFGQIIIDGEIVRLPCRMGEIFAGKYDATPRFNLEGELKFYYPIDWENTFKLWYEDEEAYENRTFVRFQSRENYKIFLSKRHASFQHQKYYKFNVNRLINQQIKYKLQEGTMSGFLTNKPKYG